MHGHFNVKYTRYNAFVELVGDLKRDVTKIWKGSTVSHTLCR